MAVLEPKYAILDETDSGLDVDAMKAVALGVKKIIEKYQSSRAKLAECKKCSGPLEFDGVGSPLSIKCDHCGYVNFVVL